MSGTASRWARRRGLGVLATCLALMFVCAPDQARAQQSDPIAQSGTFGIGLGGGTITSGLTGKYYLSRETAIQGFLGSWRDLGWSLSADFLYEFADLTENGDGRLFAGVGGGVGFAQGYRLGGNFLVLNGVFELGWHFRSFPLEIVLDVRPIVSLGPAAGVFGRYGGFEPFGVGVAFRWFFPG